MMRERVPQMRYISALTALLYIVASFVDRAIAPQELIPMMTAAHLYILPPLLLIIFLSTFRPKLFLLTLTLMVSAPVIATILNQYIVFHVEQPPLRLTEVYLILFWTFTVSGLRLKCALISGTSSLLIIFFVTTYLLEMSREEYVMHCFWMGASYAFGLLSAYLIEHSNRSLFINEEQLKRVAVTDKLTGLFNRTKLDEVLHEELERSRRYHNSFGLILLDFDHFKKVNDTFGHQTGDQVLKEIADLITKELRTNDKAVRWGGEEFILIYLDITKKELMMMAERLRKKIEAYSFEKIGHKTASLGITTSQDNDTIDTLIQRADQALFKAKSAGRNCTKYL